MWFRNRSYAAEWRTMNRKRALKCDTFCAKRGRSGAAEPLPAAAGGGGVAAGDRGDRVGGALDIKASLEHIMSLLPGKLWSDTVPRIALKHQLYSLHRDRTRVDRHLLGFDSESVAVVFAADFKAKVLAAEVGRATQGPVEKFLNTVLASCCDMSVDETKMLQEFLFADSEITQLVKCGVLTVKDAGSWWLSIPNSGRFTKYFIQGRKAVLGMIRKSKYSEMLKSDLEGRQTTSRVKFHIQYHIHDIVGAELVDCIETTAGVLLRFADS